MGFRTQVELPSRMPAVEMSDRLLMMGSCFAENMGRFFAERKFRVDVNPFGILYNPLSIAEALRRLLDGAPYTADELLLYQGRWHSLMHHGSFSAASPDEALRLINSRFRQSRENLDRQEWLMLTFGTSYVYRWKATGQVVANCHKFPEDNFVRRRLTVEEVTDVYIPLLETLKQRNPKLKCLLTVSPIRHLRDGLHANQLSKAVLLLAAERLVEHFPQWVFYFPSYEIVTDELRDYRFYADDMVHPSSLAENYLWECFGRTFFSDGTRRIMALTESVARDLEHKPFHPESEAYKRFLEKIVLKIEQLNRKYPYLDFQKEMEQCRTRLNK